MMSQFQNRPWVVATTAIASAAAILSMAFAPPAAYAGASSAAGCIVACLKEVNKVELARNRCLAKAMDRGISESEECIHKAGLRYAEALNKDNKKCMATPHGPSCAYVLLALSAFNPVHPYLPCNASTLWLENAPLAADLNGYVLSLSEAAGAILPAMCGYVPY